MSSWECIEFFISVEKILNYFALTPIVWDAKAQKVTALKDNPKTKMKHLTTSCGNKFDAHPFSGDINDDIISYFLYCFNSAENSVIADWIVAKFFSGVYLLATSVYINYLRFGDEFSEL